MKMRSKPRSTASQAVSPAIPKPARTPAPRRTEARERGGALPLALEGEAVLPAVVDLAALERVREALPLLPVRYRHFLELDLVERLSPETICVELEIDLPTFKSLKYLAFGALLRTLRKGLPG